MKNKSLLVALIGFFMLGCEEDVVVPEPSVEIESSISSIVESSVYEGEPGDVIEFTVTAKAPAGLETFYIELFQSTGGGQSTHTFVELTANSAEVVNNAVEYTFTRELTESDFAESDNFIRTTVKDVNGKSATRGFRLERN